jgi:hypothetical protein
MNEDVVTHAWTDSSGVSLNNPNNGRGAMQIVPRAFGDKGFRG